MRILLTTLLLALVSLPTGAMENLTFDHFPALAPASGGGLSPTVGKGTEACLFKSLDLAAIQADGPRSEMSQPQSRQSSALGSDPFDLSSWPLGQIDVSTAAVISCQGACKSAYDATWRACDTISNSVVRAGCYIGATGAYLVCLSTC